MVYEHLFFNLTFPTVDTDALRKPNHFILSNVRLNLNFVPKQENLNKSELLSITKEAEKPIYREQNLLLLGRKSTDIVRVSISKNLILIYGNKHTGLQHINLRHSRFQGEPFWKKTKGNSEEYILDNPSSFSVSTIPFFDYIRIAEDLFKEENLNLKNNTNKKYCDLYEGEVTLNHIEKSRYRLVLYKDTRIIHSLYPVEDKFTQKKIVNYYKGSASITEYLASCITIIKVPYLNHENIVIYRAIFRLDDYNRTDRLYIEMNSKEGKPFISKYIGEKPLTYDIHNPSIMMGFQFTDLSMIEEIISKIDKEINWA